MPNTDSTPIPKIVRTPNNSKVLVGTTDFSRLNRNQKSVWVKKLWQHARNQSFVMRFSGTSVNSMIQRITDLTETSRGEKAIMQLVQDLTGQGVTGDYALEGREEEMRSFDTEITIDQLRNATRNVGRMTTQRNILSFREQSKDKLGYWLADIVDQLGFLTLSGVPYQFNTDGSLRVDPRGGTMRPMSTDRAVAIGTFSGTKSDSYGYDGMSGTSLSELEFAKRIHAPSPNRCFRWQNKVIDNSGKVLREEKLVALADEKIKDANGADVSGTLADKRVAHLDNIQPQDHLTYNALVTIRTELKTQHMRGIRGNHGDEFYHIFLHPKAYLKLKLDADYKESIRFAAQRGSSNPIFSGGTVTLDGMVIHEYHHVFNTLNSAKELKGGAGDAVTLKTLKATVDTTRTDRKTKKDALGVAESDYRDQKAVYEKALKDAKGNKADTTVVDEKKKHNVATAALTAARVDLTAAEKAYLDAVEAVDKLSGGVDYCRVLFCGSQALGMCSLDGSPIWVEKEFDYENSLGIASGRIFGFEKPQFPSRNYIQNPANFMNDPYEHLEDFGVAVLDVAI
jgi:hypothetical protein